MIALMDYDIFVHRVGYVTEEETLDTAIDTLDSMIGNTLFRVDAQICRGYVTDSENNFRKEIYPDYHANRIHPKPKWYEELKERVLVFWNGHVAVGQEADDSLGIAQWKYFSDDPEFGATPNDCIICSIDKDLLQIPGQHYNFVRGERRNVTIEEGLKHFYKQLLIGDTADNIRGVDSIGPKKAEKALGNCNTEQEMFEVVRKLYNNDERLLLNGQLLKIRTREGEIWTFPSETTQKLPL